MSATAKEDLFRLYDHIAEDSPPAARAWVDALERQAATLERFPLRCPPTPESRESGKPYRHLIYGAYRLIFRIVGETVFVVRIVHGAQMLDFDELEPLP